MKELERVGVALEEDLVADNLTDVVVELSNFSIGQISKEIGTEIPGVSYFVNAVKIFNSIRDLRLMEKVNAFLFDWGKIDKQARTKFTDKMENDPIFGQKAGAFIISALDRFDFSIKAKYLVKLCKSYGEGYFSKETFVILTKAIDILSVFNIQRFLADEEFNLLNIQYSDDQFSEFLNAGVLMYDIRLRFDNSKHRASGIDGFETRPELSSKRTQIARILFNTLNDNTGQIVDVRRY